MKEHKLVAYFNGYNVIVDDQIIGNIFKTRRYGYTCWRYTGAKHNELYSTRREAAERLIEGLNQEG